MNYPGAKGQDGTWQRIIGQMPPHSVYVEPFAGSAQIFFHKRPADRNVLIDVAAGAHANLNVAHRRHTSEMALPSRSVKIIRGDALKILPTLALPDDAVVYCDPPYLLSTRQGRFYYEHEFSDLQHIKLLALLKSLKCHVLISGYPSDLYDVKLKGWRCDKYQTRTRGRTLIECLWMNFPEPVELHDWRFAGKNYRERTTFKRLAARWLARLDAMTPRKRGYLMNEIQQRQTDPHADNGVTGDSRPPTPTLRAT